MAHCTPPAMGAGGCGCCMIVVGWIIWFVIGGSFANNIVNMTWHAEGVKSFSFKCQHPDIVLMYTKYDESKSFSQRIATCNVIYNGIKVKFSGTEPAPTVVNGCSRNKENPTTPSILTSLQGQAFLHRDIIEPSYESWFPMTNASETVVAVRRRLSSGDSGGNPPGFDYVGGFEYWTKDDPSGAKDEHGDIKKVCVEGTYSVTSQYPIWAIEAVTKIAEMAGAVVGMLGGGMFCIGLCCCGCCLACIGGGIALASSPPNRVYDH